MQAQSPSSEAAAVYISALTSRDEPENEVIATAHCNLQLHFNGIKWCFLPCNVQNVSKEICAAVWLTILLQEENPQLRGAQRPQAGGGSPRQWQVHKAGALTAYQVTPTSAAAGSAYWDVEIGSEGKGTACVMLWRFYATRSPKDAQSQAKILLCQQIPEIAFLLSTLRRQNRSRMRFMGFTYHRGSRKNKIFHFLLFLIYVQTESLSKAIFNN